MPRRERRDGDDRPGTADPLDERGADVACTPARPVGSVLYVLSVLSVLCLVGAQLAGASPAAAATGPTAVDDVGTFSVSAGGRIPYAANGVRGSAPLRLDLSGFPADQLSSLPAGSSIDANGVTVT